MSVLNVLTRKIRNKYAKITFMAVLVLVFVYPLLKRPGGEHKNAPRRGARNIMFVETSCVTPTTSSKAPPLPEGMIRLTEREACALEAAARLNPNRPVILAHTCPLKDTKAARAKWPAHVRAALSLPNVRVWPITFARAFKGTPHELQEVVEGNSLDRSAMPERDAANLLRYTLLWRYGGTAVDLSCIMHESLKNLQDFVVMESSNKISSLIADFSLDHSGRVLATEVLDKMSLFIPNNIGLWDWSVFATQIFSSLCEATEADIPGWRCYDVKILSTKRFFPVEKDRAWSYFNEADARPVMKKVEGSMGIVLAGSYERIRVASNQPVAQVARKACPRVVATLDTNYM